MKTYTIQFKKEMSVEDFSKTDEFKTLEQAGLMSVEPNKLYSKSVKTLKMDYDNTPAVARKERA